MRQALARSVAGFRLAALGYAIFLMVANHHDYRRPALGWIVLAAMVVWTVVATAGYVGSATSGTAWPWWLLGADLAIAVGAVSVTIAVYSTARIDGGAPTLPAAWAAAAVLSWAVAGGPWLGGAAGAAVAVADIVERRALTQHTFNGVVLLLMAGFVGGYLVRLGQAAQDSLEAATRHAAAAAERDRLARDIHDSALQVLALVAKRGAALGGEAAELAALAGAQEVALRRLVGSPALDVTPAGDIDLRELFDPVAGPSVTISSPAFPVIVSESVGMAARAAVAEALANVVRHAGSTARAWVLVEAEPESATVTVRDDGVGIEPGRLSAAAHSGRLGVAQSILGRIEAVGGVVSIVSSPGQGTEVEIRVPRPGVE